MKSTLGSNFFLLLSHKKKLIEVQDGYLAKVPEAQDGIYAEMVAQDGSQS